MDSVETGGQAKVGAVIHDPADILSERKTQIAGVAQDLAGASLFVTVLDQSRAARAEVADEFKQVVLAGKVGCVHDGIDTRQHRGLNSQGGLLGSVFVAAGEKTAL